MATPEQLADAQRRLRIARAQQMLAARREQGGMSWGEVGAGAVENLWPSAKQYAQDVARPVTHPVETGKALWTLAQGLVSKLIPGEQPSEQAVDSLVRFMGDRYGGEKQFKRTLHDDPVGVLGDVSAFLTGGGALAARLPGMAGKVGQAVGAAGAAVDPLSIVGKGAALTGRAAGEVGAHALGLTTGAKGEAVKRAAATGREGGERGQIFRDEMRGAAPMDEAVNEAKQAVANLYEARSQRYKMGMKGALEGKDKPLKFEGIGKAIEKVDQVAKFKDVELSPQTAGVRREIKDLIAKWNDLDPAQYHTPAGFDALKKAIGNIEKNLEVGSPSRKVAKGVYDAVKKEIIRQAPEYASVMKEYWRASEELKEIERALSLGHKANAETSLRKLQSIVRKDVSSAFGRRGELAQTLEAAGAPHLTDRMAGQALSSPLPRGMATVMSPTLTGGAAIGVSPAALALAPLMSPRAVGEAVHAGGRAVGAVERSGARMPSPLVRALAHQGGRAADPELERRGRSY